MNTITGISTEAIQSVADGWKSDIITMGYHAANRQWFTPLIDAWLDAIEGNAHTNDNWKAGLLAVLRDSKSIRDALLLSVIDSRLTRDMLLGVAADPHTPETRELVGRTLTNGFENPDAKPDCERFARAFLTLIDLSAASDEPEYESQPLAAAAWLAWWAGDKDAGMLASAALAIDEENSLATLVLAAGNRHPAYLG
ncbi:hypothetical protein [Bifidobacterium miconisargentati]|uniref:hypothetical protein n=1 Tax=Bifidobacterium miconisargentati TaxID=2834437 RepID=UPI001BDD1475|nr:hypothetical protein [Bifidobacterium miconisargentati]MBW3089201.1 hypothetical protein [Bifidobacterium miconisargentati]